MNQLYVLKRIGYPDFIGTEKECDVVIAAIAASPKPVFCDLMPWGQP